MDPSAAIDPPQDPTARVAKRPLFVPRGLVVLASIWIFLSWVSLFGFHPPVQPQAASYAPSIQLLMMLIGIGIAIGWPLLRLSARPSSMPTAQAALDGLSIFVLFQVVVWPLRLVTNWTIARAVAVDASIASAIMLTAAILSITQGSCSPRTRAGGMLAAVVLVLAPLAIGARASDSSWGRMLTAPSAPALIARCAEPSTIDPSQPDRGLLFRAYALASAAWAVALGVHALGPSAKSRVSPAN